MSTLSTQTVSTLILSIALCTSICLNAIQLKKTERFLDESGMIGISVISDGSIEAFHYDTGVITTYVKQSSKFSKSKFSKSK